MFICSNDVSQDTRLRSGDQILHIGDTDLAGMSSEQVAQVLNIQNQMSYIYHALQKYSYIPLIFFDCMSKLCILLEFYVID